jgi:hypothetical protein
VGGPALTNLRSKQWSIRAQLKEEIDGVNYEENDFLTRNIEL